MILSPPKPHKTYSELVSLLKQRGMTVPDEERAKRKLAQIGYYRLSGFWYPCRKGKVDESGEYVRDMVTKHPVREDDFQDGTNFTDIIEMYLFDKKLRQLMLDAIERVEIHVRSVIAHEVGRFDPMAYQKESFINPKILRDTKDREGNVINYWQEWAKKQKDL
ncbi:MAG: Abi family protein [Deltaproteobacteria bacterium]|nr:Abi family protein [Deltaproteobacteria bacterium]